MVSSFCKILAFVFILELGICAPLKPTSPFSEDDVEPDVNPGTYAGSGIQLVPLVALDLESRGIFCLACAKEMLAMLALPLAADAPPGVSMEPLIVDSPLDSSWSFCFPKKFFWSRVSLSLPFDRT